MRCFAFFYAPTHCSLVHRGENTTIVLCFKRVKRFWVIFFASYLKNVRITEKVARKYAIFFKPDWDSLQKQITQYIVVNKHNERLSFFLPLCSMQSNPHTLCFYFPPHTHTHTHYMESAFIDLWRSPLNILSEFVEYSRQNSRTVNILLYVPISVCA